MKLDCLICIVPFITPICPLLGPSVISSTLKNNNYTSKIIDFNIILHEQRKSIWSEYTWHELLMLSINKGKIFNKKFESILDEWIEVILKHESTYVAFTLFTYNSIMVTIALIKKLKKYNKKIILGGEGVEQFIKRFPQYENDIAHYVNGYGEKSILKIMKGTKLKHLKETTNDFSSTYVPDFSDFKLKKYEHTILSICTSIGCVYNCTFCRRSEKYKYLLKPLDLIEEELKQIKKYNYNIITVNDNIVNVDYKRLKQICFLLEKYNIKWSSSWRIRLNVPFEIYDILKKSNCYLFSIGIESGSEKVRKKMNKPFSNKTILENLINLDKVEIISVLQFIIGYPDETDDDFEETLNLLDLLHKNKLSRFIFIFNPYRPTIKSITKELTSEEMNKTIDKVNFLYEYVKKYDFTIHDFSEINFTMFKRERDLKLLC